MFCITILYLWFHVAVSSAQPFLATTAVELELEAWEAEPPAQAACILNQSLGCRASIRKCHHKKCLCILNNNIKCIINNTFPCVLCSVARSCSRSHTLFPPIEAPGSLKIGLEACQKAIQSHTVARALSAPHQRTYLNFVCSSDFDGTPLCTQICNICHGLGS